MTQPALDFTAPAPNAHGTRYAPPAPMRASREARAAMPPEVLTAQQQAIRDALMAAGPDGLTDEEGIARTGINPSSYRPRRGELCALNLVTCKPDIFRLTRAGRKASIWVSVPHRDHFTGGAA